MKSKPSTLLFILTILAVLLPPTSTSADTSYKSLSVTSSSLPPIPKVELLSQFGGTVNTIAVQGDYAYAGIVKRLVVFDISDPANPTLADQTEPWPQIIKDIAIKGNYAYVVDEGANVLKPTGTFEWKGGLRIIDISNPAQPAVVKTYTIPKYPHCIQIIGDYVYITTDYALQIFYLNSPTDLVLKGEFNAYITDGQAVVQDTTAYITNPSDDELYIVDVSNPVTPTKISTYNMLNVGVVAAQGDYVHLAEIGMYASSEVQIIDVSDPAHPTSAGSYDIGSPEYLYTEAPQEITLQGNYAYVAGNMYGVHIVDISDPTAPVVAASPKIDGGANTVQITGNHAYAAGNGGGLWSLDVSTPTAPTLSGVHHQLGGARNITLNGQYAYSASRGLNIIDVSNPAQPQETDYRSEGGKKVVISNDHAYQIIYNKEDPPNPRVTISDISDPSNPHKIGQLDVAGYPQVLAAAGNFVYVGIAFSGNAGEVLIIDVSNPAVPQVRGSFPTSTAYSSGYPNNLAIRDDILYVCQPGFRILDVSDPDNPVEIEHDLPILQPKYITLAGDYAYIATGSWGDDTGLWILDISDPAHPTTAGSCASSYGWTSTSGIAISGNYVFVATYAMGLMIFDISNPAQPAQVLMILSQYGHELCDVAARGEYVYLADNEQGLSILKVTSDANLIYGHIWRQNFIGRPVQIAVGDNITKTTDGADNYIVPDLPAGNYTVTPLTPGYIWVPQSHTATLPRSQPESLDFTAHNFYKEVNTGGIPIPRDGDILTYTLSLVYPMVFPADNLYDPIPDQTTYLTNSLSAPSGITYDPTLDAIIGTVPLTPNLTTQVSYAVRIVVTNTTGLPQPPITNQACLHYYETNPPSSCYDLSNEVIVSTWAVYLPLVLR